LITVLGSDFGLLRLRGMKALLRAMLRQRRAILAPNAGWMRPELERMFGDLAEVCTIPFGVGPAWFAVDRHPLSDGRNWLVVTRVTREKIGSLFEWGEGLFGADRQLHLFGPMQEDIRIPQWVNYHGATHPVELQRVWFAQTCGLISLSNHDEGRPQVVLEAMAAGLPVIVSDLSAHRDIVKHKGNGCIVAAPDELDLGLKWLEDPVQNMEVGNAARAFVSGTIGTWDDCAERYSDAYRKLLEPTL
jgi:glycosyltransferase involved in cell wall biosynthesis